MPPFLLYVGIWYLIAQLDDPYIDICVLIIILQPRSQRNIVQQCTRNRTPMVNYWLKRTHIYSINLSDSEIVCSTYQWVGIVMKRKKRAFLSNQIVPMGRRPWYIFKLYVLYFYFSVLLYLCILYSLCRSPPLIQARARVVRLEEGGRAPRHGPTCQIGAGFIKVFCICTNVFSILYVCARYLYNCITEFCICINVLGICITLFFLFVPTIQTNPTWQNWDQYYLSFVFYILVILKQTSDCTYINI